MVKETTMLLALATGVLVSCNCVAHSDPPALPAGWDILQSDPGNAAPVSRKVLLIADNQAHYLYGSPFLQRSVFADKYFSSVAIRSPQLDLFGQELFRWALDKTPAMPVIHLGDAIDLSCARELDDFVDIMERSGRLWVMAPGNHDGYFFGNFDDTDHFWRRACEGGGGPLHKDDLIARYLAVQSRGRPSLAEALRQHPETGQWRCEPAVEDDCFLQRVRWSIDRQARWKSYVLQKIDLGSRHSDERSSAILLDSAQYSAKPHTLFLHAGREGSILADQAAAARQWLASASSEHIALAIHHPYQTLTRSGQGLIQELMSAPATVVLLSAHTHAGRYYNHGKGAGAWLELNVGSILDWPIEYRTLAFRRRLTGDGSPEQRHIILASELARLPAQWSGEASVDGLGCHPSWEAKPGEADYYLDYRSLSTLSYVSTQRAIFDNLLAAYERMFRCLPAASEDSESARSGGCRQRSEVKDTIDGARSAESLDEKRQVLEQLGRYARERAHADPARLDHYRLCQARWASFYEDRRARVPQPQDEHILIPRALETKGAKR